MGNDEPILVGKRVLEKELEKLQRKLNGPKNTAKHIEAKQKWINRESKRIETESAKLVEMQESLRVRKETLKNSLRVHQDTPRRLATRGRNDGQKQEPHLSPESTGELRNLEQQESNFWRGARDWLDGREMHRQRRLPAGRWKRREFREVEAKNSKLQEAIEKESTMKDVRISDDDLDGLDGSLSSWRCKRG